MSGQLFEGVTAAAGIPAPPTPPNSTPMIPTTVPLTNLQLLQRQWLANLQMPPVQANNVHGLIWNDKEQRFQFEKDYLAQKEHHRMNFQLAVYRDKYEMKKKEIASWKLTVWVLNQDIIEHKEKEKALEQTVDELNKELQSQKASFQALEGKKNSDIKILNATVANLNNAIMVKNQEMAEKEKKFEEKEKAWEQTVDELNKNLQSNNATMANLKEENTQVNEYKESLMKLNETLKTELVYGKMPKKEKEKALKKEKKEMKKEVKKEEKKPKMVEEWEEEEEEEEEDKKDEDWKEEKKRKRRKTKRRS